jgi:hypothetical protein
MSASKRTDAIKRDNDKFNESLAVMKREREICVEGAQHVSAGLSAIEKTYNDESYEVALTNESAQMERLISSVEMNSLKACSALEEVNNQLAKLVLEQTDDKKVAENAPPGPIEEFLSPQDTEALQKAAKIKIDAAASRLREIFLKATNQYNHVITTFSSVSNDQQEQEEREIFDDDERRQIALIPSLQKKVKELKKELELAEMKARSVIVQRFRCTLSLILH